MDLTPAQQKILSAVLSRPDWQVCSLFRLATDLEIDYRHARWCVRDLARQGLLEIDRPSGREMRIGVLRRYEPGGFPPVGAVSSNKLSIVHRSQYGGIQMGDNTQSSNYQRPELTDAEKKHLLRLANQINGLRDAALRLSYVASLVFENSRMLAEINEHRSARGFEPMPAYSAEKGSPK